MAAGAPLDTLTVKLSYFGHKEDYKLMLVNGKPTALDYLHAGGALSTGEFGTRLLLGLRTPIARANSTGRVGPLFANAASPGFPIASTARIRSSASSTAPYPTAPNSIVVPYHGEVFVDEETHMVLRMTQQAEIPPGFPITVSESTVDYEFAEVGGKPYLLPTCCPREDAQRRFVGREHRGVPRLPQVPDRNQHQFRSRQTVTPHGFPPVISRAPRFRVK